MNTECAIKGHQPVEVAERAFMGPVAQGDFENRAAHGNITRTYECERCKMQRKININGLHEEVGSWHRRG